MKKLTPMMAQYKAIKEKYSDCILMFRMGDFYEMFFEDALVAAGILQITLTARGKNGANKAPMCGVPFHAVDQYLPKLTRAGKKVAVCDQITEPTGKGIVEREVVRVVTPGTTFDEGLLDRNANNYVACVVEVPMRAGDGAHFGFAYADVTTGDFRVTEFEKFSELENEMQRVDAAECICAEELTARVKQGYVFPYSYMKDADVALKESFGVKSLSVFGLEGHVSATLAAGMLYEYLKETQKTDLKHIQRIAYYGVADFMPLDEACIRNLELFRTSRGAKEGSLVWAMDNAVTAMGGRLLRNWVLHPLLKKSEIDVRLKEVDKFVGDSSLMRSVREELGKIYDIERLLSRLSLGTGNARDLVAMKDSLKVIPSLNELTGATATAGSATEITEFPELVALLEESINDECPISVRDGGMIRGGYDNELDELRSISTEGKTFIKDLQERESKRTGISTLKVKFNKVFGYYIEISRANAGSVPDDYVRKQTLVNAERYITPELKEYEEKVLTAEDRIKELEYELFYKIRMEVVKELVKLQQTAKVLAGMDVYSCFAFNAERGAYCRPEVSEATATAGSASGIELVGSRHPVIEKIGSDFVPNDCEMNADQSFLLITGPNMGGKSTYLRQVALCVLMAQIGSFVPAQTAKIGVVDRIFTRVGASDNLVAGDSTFMVEMQEASYILNHATERSLIILDEVGRGTSTYDGVSIAWAIMEFIHDRLGSKTLFATHYHELIELADRLSHAKNMSVAVRENEKEGVVFLYKVVEGGVDKSYGIEVAKLAGLPVDVVGRARGVLSELESKKITKKRVDPNQVELFEENRVHRELLKDLSEVDVNNLTPIEALRKLNEMKKKTGN
ncbi:MAG: DNA mismatch repair protein MutS [Nitrospirae bacterium]|nr:DNA mismatch repair protein MutS [Nitrospirota bacterium]